MKLKDEVGEQRHTNENKVDGMDNNDRTGIEWMNERLILLQCRVKLKRRHPEEERNIRCAQVSSSRRK